MESKVDKLYAHKLVSIPVDLSKLNDVVKNDVVEKDEYNAQKKKVENKVPDIANLTTNTTLNAKMNEVENSEIPSITNLATVCY